MPTSTVRALCSRGQIVSVKIGRQWRINRDALYRQFGISSKFTDRKGEAPALVLKTTARAS